jgi:hypothetical protein
MLESIVLTSYFFGSVYLFSKSLEFINRAYLQDNKIPDKLIVLNGLTFVMTGTVVLYSYSLLNLPHFKSSKV